MTEALLQDRRGSVTIEAALVVSALLSALAVLIFSFMIMYQQVLLSRTASLAAQEAAQLWVQDNSLYYRLFADDVLAGDQEIIYSGFATAENGGALAGLSFYQRKFAQIKKLAAAPLQKTISKPQATTIKINYDNSLLTRRIHVTINQELAIPLGSLQSFFADKDTLTLTGVGRAVIAEPVGYIRNIDLALEYGTKFKEAVDLTTLRQKLKERVRK